jgi:hypothetical protein
VGRGCEPTGGDGLRLTGGEWKGEVGADPKDNQGSKPEIREKTEGATAENSGITKWKRKEKVGQEKIKEQNKAKRKHHKKEKEVKRNELPSFVVSNAFNTEGNRDDDEGGRGGGATSDGEVSDNVGGVIHESLRLELLCSLVAEFDSSRFSTNKKRVLDTDGALKLHDLGLSGGVISVFVRNDSNTSG